MGELAEPDRGGVAVAGHAEIDEIAVGEIGAGQHRRHAAVHGIEAVRFSEKIRRGLRRAADARELGDAVRRQRQLEARLDDGAADRIVAAARAQGRDRALVIAMRIAERIGRQFRMMQPRLGDVGHQGSALRSGARVTTESMSAIALTMNRAVIGVPS